MEKIGPIANMQTNEESSLDIFEMFVETNEPTKEEVNKELQMFTRFQVDVKDIKCSLEWWAKHKSLFPIMAFLVHQFLALLVLKWKLGELFHSLEFLQIRGDVSCNKII
jgi:hypothetical protein